MATIPEGQQFHTLAATVDTVERGSAQTNSDRTVFTMKDIADTIVHPADAIEGSGTAKQIPLWNGDTTITNSLINQEGANITFDSTINLKNLNAAPAGPGDTGLPGMIRFVKTGEEGYIYLCIEADVWVRAALTTF